ncbi:hypothetical protein GCM10009714_39540 [Microlunatus capsulatus]
MFAGGWPAFIEADAEAARHLPAIRATFGHLEVALLQDDVLVAAGWGVPLAWDGTVTTSRAATATPWPAPSATTRPPPSPTPSSSAQRRSGPTPAAPVSPRPWSTACARRRRRPGSPG